jgi:RHS repeat-associated protein
LTEPGGAVSRFTTNRWGSPRQFIDALGHITATVFDANGLPVRVSYPNGSVDSATYNAKGLPTFAQTADSTNRRHITYNGTWNEPDSAWGGPAPALHAWIGSNGRVDSVRVAGQSKSKFIYSSTGRLVSITDPNGNMLVKHFFSGANANTTQDSVPGGWLTTYYYDSYGRDTATKAPVTPARRTHYDTVNRAIEMYDGVYATPTVFLYDSLDHVTRLTVKSQVYAFAYNALGWLVARTDPAGLADSLKYNSDGDVIIVRDRRGQTINFAYDALHRPTARFGTNVDSVAWRFSADGRVDTSATSVVTAVNYLNVRGQFDSVKTMMANQIFWKRYHYTTRGIEDSLRISGAGIAFRPRAYTVDTLRFVLTGIRLGAATAGSTSLTYDPAGNRSLATYRGAPVSSAYDSREQLGSISSTAAFGDSVLRLLSFDGEGRLTRAADKGGAHSRKFTYDALGRLDTDSDQVIVGNPPPDCDGNPPPILGANGSNCLDSETWTSTGGAYFTYDSLGNRTDHAGTYLAGNRIQSFAGCTYANDPDGSITSRRCPGDTVTFRWSADGLLDTVVAAGRTTSFRYDADGFPVRKDSAGVPSRYFLWDGGNILAELTGTADSERAEFSFFPGLDKPHAIVLGSTEFDVQADEIGNVIALTDSAQAVRRGYAVDAWGNLVATGGDIFPNGADRSRFKGAALLGEEANVYYMRARWYEPSTGRFLSEDPLGIQESPNLYIYGDNDPINTSDPAGLCEYIYYTNERGGIIEYQWARPSVDCTDELAGAGGGGSGQVGLGGSVGGLGYSSPDNDPKVAALIRQAEKDCRNAIIGLELAVLGDAFLFLKGIGILAKSGRVYAQATRFAARSDALMTAGRYVEAAYYDNWAAQRGSRALALAREGAQNVVKGYGSSLYSAATAPSGESIWVTAGRVTPFVGWWFAGKDVKAACF